jgi:hypothetical protein
MAPVAPTRRAITTTTRPTLAELRAEIALRAPALRLLSRTRVATQAHRQEAAMKLESALVVVCAVAFAACTIKGPEVRVKPPIEVKVDGGDDRGGKFCPPGQAKKGRC